MDSELDLSEFCCLNEDCPDHGKKGKGNRICLAHAQFSPE